MGVAGRDPAGLFYRPSAAHVAAAAGATVLAHARGHAACNSQVPLTWGVWTACLPRCREAQEEGQYAEAFWLCAQCIKSMDELGDDLHVAAQVHEGRALSRACSLPALNLRLLLVVSLSKASLLLCSIPP